MANTSSKVKKTSAKKTEVVETVEPQVKEEKVSYRVKKDIDPNTIVVVKNGFNGTLIYKSKKTGERFEWPAFGDEQEMDLAELKSAKNSYKNFFINNWFLFDDPEIIDYLGMSQYYKNALSYDEFDKLFEKEPSEIKEIIPSLSTGQKKSLAFRAKQMIADEKIDSIKVINALEESLSVELIER